MPWVLFGIHYCGTVVDRLMGKFILECYYMYDCLRVAHVERVGMMKMEMWRDRGKLLSK